MEKVRVGIIGCGMITARRHAPEYTDNPHSEVAALYDFDQERARELAVGYGAKVYATVEELVADPGIDAVSICSPNSTHAPYSIMALEAGKHVLCEKPMALELADTRRMMEAAEKAGKILMIGHNQRLLPTHRKARELLQSGMIGNILSVQSNFRHRGPEYWSVNRSNSTWFFDKDKAHFGALGDLGAHKLDIIRFLTGDEVEDICCETVTRDKRYPDGRRIDLEDNASAIFHMKSGVFGTMNVSWTNYGGQQHHHLWRQGCYENFWRFRRRHCSGAAGRYPGEVPGGVYLNQPEAAEKRHHRRFRGLHHQRPPAHRYRPGRAQHPGCHRGGEEVRRGAPLAKGRILSGGFSPAPPHK